MSVVHLTAAAVLLRSCWVDELNAAVTVVSTTTGGAWE